MPLSPPPALPTDVLDATPQVQELADAVKEKVPAMLARSGWRPSLEPFKAIVYCGDSMNYVIKVKVADCLDKNCTYPILHQLQLLIHVPHGKGAKEAMLTGAMMVQVVKGSCAGLPVMPTLEEAYVQDLVAPESASSNTELFWAAVWAGFNGKKELINASYTAPDSVTDAVTEATKAAKGAATNAAKSADGAADAASGALGKAAKFAYDAADGATAAVASATKLAKGAADNVTDDNVTDAVTEATEAAEGAATEVKG